MFYFFIKICLICFFVCACGTNEVGSSLKIWGGQPLDQNHPAKLSAVGLGLKAADLSIYFCSGVLVAPNLVLTAAHCIYRNINEISRIMIHFGENILPDVEHPVFFATDAKYHEKYDSSDRKNLNYDIAWIKFDDKENILQNFQTPLILKNPHQLFENQVISLTGYGAPSSQEWGSYGKLLGVEVQFKKYVNNDKWKSFIVYSSTSDKTACHGDSGGPAYTNIDGIWYLIGTASGANVIDYEDPNCYIGEGLYTFVGDYIEWIENTSNVKLSVSK